MLDTITPALVSRYRDVENELGQHGLVIGLPVEFLHYDLLLHGDLSFARAPEVMLCGNLTGTYASLGALAQEQSALPIAEKVIPLGRLLSTPDVPRVTEMAEHLCGQVGRQLDEFRGYRFTIRYPPIPTKLYLSYPLMTR